MKVIPHALVYRGIPIRIVIFCDFNEWNINQLNFQSWITKTILLEYKTNSPHYNQQLRNSDEAAVAYYRWPIRCLIIDVDNLKTQRPLISELILRLSAVVQTTI